MVDMEVLTTTRAYEHTLYWLLDLSLTCLMVYTYAYSINYLENSIFPPSLLTIQQINSIFPGIIIFIALMTYLKTISKD